MRRGFVLIAFGLLAAVLLAGCGDDDSGDPTASGSGSASGSASASASGVAECEPVGSGGTEVPVTLDEWSVTVEGDSVEAGDVRFVIDNTGDEAHELVVVQADAADELPVADGQVVEDELPAGAFIGEVEAFPAGDSCEGSFELTAGRYVLFCNIVEEEDDGQVESHFEQGMHTTLEVE